MNDSAKIWESLRLTVEPEGVEAIEFAFNSLESLGTEIDYMSQPVAGVCVVGYFDRLPDDEILQDELHYALRAYELDENAVLAVERTAIENTDWLAEWKKHWKPSTVGRFVIAPPWESVNEPDKIVIRIEPNMAFGTGTHETTRLCLSAIDKYYKPADSFLDVGTGTGILVIAAAKLNARNTSGSESAPILACDTDPDAIKIARENAELNGVDNFIDFFDGEISSETPHFDLICANLTLDVIMPIVPLLLGKAKTKLILSGILVEQESTIVKALSDREFSIERAGEWIAILIDK
jgi:ribosomal protein L11 methyltransferase